MSTTFELPLVPPTPTSPTPPAPRLSREAYVALARRVKLLSWLSLAWMTVEGAVALAAGITAGSIALVGFGLDSVVEGFASVVIIWRFTGARTFSAGAEARAQRLVAWQFFLIAPYVAFESVRGLITGERADPTAVGIALALGSVVLMPLLAIAKQRLAVRLGSAATHGEGRQNMLCAYLAAALLIGLVGNALVGAWWLDPAVGLLIAFVAVGEGRGALRGEGCGCCVSPLEGLQAPPQESDCQDACCT